MDLENTIYLILYIPIFLLLTHHFINDDYWTRAFILFFLVPFIYLRMPRSFKEKMIDLYYKIIIKFKLWLNL
jgi:hypothetical protein